MNFSFLTEYEPAPRIEMRTLHFFQKSLEKVDLLQNLILVSPSGMSELPRLQVKRKFTQWSEADGQIFLYFDCHRGRGFKL